MLLICSAFISLVGCAPSIFGVSQSKWDQLTPEQQQETMLSYYRREALGLKAYEENLAPSSVATIQSTNTDTLVFTTNQPRSFMQRFRKENVSLSSHQHNQALAHERKQQSPPPAATGPKKPMFSRYSAQKEGLSLNSHAHKQALAQQRSQTPAPAVVKKSDTKKVSAKKTSAKKAKGKSKHHHKKKSHAKSVSKPTSNIPPVSTPKPEAPPASLQKPEAAPASPRKPEASQKTSNAKSVSMRKATTAQKKVS